MNARRQFDKLKTFKNKTRAQSIRLDKLNMSVKIIPREDDRRRSIYL